MGHRVILDPLDAGDFLVSQVGPMEEVRDQAYNLVDSLDRHRNLQKVLVHDPQRQDVSGPPSLEMERNPSLSKPRRNLDLQRRELNQRDGAVLQVLFGVQLSHTFKYRETRRGFQKK